MKISKDTATSLGEKLASVDLTTEEAVLLTVMLEEEAEVSGFNFEEIKVTYRPEVVRPVKNRWNPVLSLGYTEIEWTY